MSKDPKDFVRHILDECSFIISVSQNMEFKDFIENEILKRATIRSLEIIGEAAKKIPLDFKERWNVIQWKNMAGMRDKLIHNYFGVNYSIVWDIIKNSIPDLHAKMKQVLAHE